MNEGGLQTCGQGAWDAEEGRIKNGTKKKQTLQNDPTNLLASKGVYFYLFIYLFNWFVKPTKTFHNKKENKNKIDN